MIPEFIARQNENINNAARRARRANSTTSNDQGCGIHGGDLYRAHDTNLKATLRRSIAQVIWKCIRELCFPSSQITLAGLTLYRLYYRDGKQPKEPSKTNRSKGQARLPCDMPQSGLVSARGHLPSLGQAPQGGGAPAAGEARERFAQRGSGSGPGSRLVGTRRPARLTGDRWHRSGGAKGYGSSLEQAKALRAMVLAVVLARIVPHRRPPTSVIVANILANQIGAAACPVHWASCRMRISFKRLRRSAGCWGQSALADP